VTADGIAMPPFRVAAAALRKTTEHLATWIEKPPESSPDWNELEWAIVTQGAGADISRENAPAHIFGYTIFNDVSARDVQAQDMRSQSGLGGRSKDFDTGNVLGPCLVTADEIADPYNLTMTARVNGAEWSRGNTGQMDHRFEDVLAHVSRNQTVHPGEVFGSGTVPSGCARTACSGVQRGSIGMARLSATRKRSNRPT